MKKVLKCEAPLLTPAGKAFAPIQIVYDYAEVISNPSFEITLCYNGNEYKGKGTDYLRTDTLADLKMKLPTNVKIACCMTCRHGNMCPYGNTEHILFYMRIYVFIYLINKNLRTFSSFFHKTPTLVQ